MNLSEGVKITEKEKNIVASKTKGSEVTRESFIRDYERTFFKSFIPDSGDQISAISMHTVSVDRNRPFTTDHVNRTKRTAESGN